MVAKTAAKLAASLVLTCALAACGNSSAQMQRQESSDISMRFPLTAQPKEAVLVVDNLSEERVARDPSLVARLGAFTYDFANRSQSNLLVLVGVANADDATARDVARGVARVLVRQGVSGSRMDIKLVSGNQNLKPGTVVMRYTQWVATAPECPGYDSNVMIDYGNTATPNLGCSIQRNIAAMVAHPRDLVQPSPLELREGMPGEAVIRKFSSGTETKTFEWKVAE